MNTNIAIVILAAGASKRMGSPKQLLSWENNTLLNYTIKQCLNSKASHVFVVLGSNHDLILKSLPKSSNNLIILNNTLWEEGMNTSIRLGIQKVLDEKFEAALITLTDLPYIRTEHYNKLIETYQQSKQQIVVTKYKDTKGAPTIFNKQYYKELLELENDIGAKTVVNKHKNSLVTYNVNIPYLDVDTPENYQKLLDSLGD
jgi:molybdenum cofactor cytidylyltransferase